MRIKRLKSLLYIFSSVMVLGLALVSFDSTDSAQHTVQMPTSVPTEAAGTPTPSPTVAPTNTPTPSPTTTPTPSPTPSPTPFPSLTEIHAGIVIRPATNEIGTVLTDLITTHLKNYYSDETLQVKEINNISCYYKQGIGSVDYFVYVSYDIVHHGSNVPIPTLDEYLITMDGETPVISTETDDEVVKEALLLSRSSKSVSSLYIQELIRCYMNAKLACDEELLSSIVTNPAYLNMESIRLTTMHIMEYRNQSCLIHQVPDNVKEFDYIAYLSSDVKISTLTTPIPGLDEFMIKLDENNYPKIFLGETSIEAETARIASQQQEDFLQLNATIDAKLMEIMATDPDVLEFMERIHNATEQ